MRRALALAICAGLAACEAPSPPPPAPASGGPAGSAAARVGDVAIGAEQVARVAAAQRVTPAEARDLMVRDALFAEEARARGLDAGPDMEKRVSALLARHLVQDISDEAQAEGPVTDAELDEITARHWMELDRPDAARTTHAVVMLKKDAAPEVRARAQALAESIRKAAASAAEVAQRSEPASDPKGKGDEAAVAFREAASGVENGDLEVRVEVLAPVVADGRTFSEGLRLEEAFARAALLLARRGDVSPIVETQYGLHVIFLLERIAGHVVPREERRAQVREEAVTLRALRVRQDLLARLRPSSAISKSTDALLALVPVER